MGWRMVGNWLVDVFGLLFTNVFTGEYNFRQCYCVQIHVVKGQKMTSDLDYRAIRKRVEAGVSQQKFRTRRGFFFGTLFTYAVFLIIGWAIFLSSGGAEASALLASGRSSSPLVGAMIMLSMSGLMGLIFQGVSLALDTKRGEDSIRERLVAREINQEMLKMGLDDVEEHQKRKGMMRLTDDGELEEVVEEVAAASSDVPLQGHQ